MSNYSVPEIKSFIDYAVECIKSVNNNQFEGNFKQENKFAIRQYLESFDRAGLYRELDSCNQNQLRNVYMACINWLDKIGVDYVPIGYNTMQKQPIAEFYPEDDESEISGLVYFNPDTSMILPAASNESEDNYWLITDDGYLEFNGGGWLRNSHGEIMANYNGNKAIGSIGIQTGLKHILNEALEDGEYTDDAVIKMMGQAGLNCYTTNFDQRNKESWMWDLKENMTLNDKRRIKLPDEVVEYYGLFEPGWRMSSGFKDDSDPYSESYLHAGEDWVYVVNNQNRTIGQPVYSPVAGIVKDADFDIRLGYFIRITLKDGGEFNLFHLQKDSLKVDRDDSVIIGDHIANGGDTGSTCQGAHVHMEVRYASKENPSIIELDDSEILNRFNKYYVDPKDMLN